MPILSQQPTTPSGAVKTRWQGGSFLLSSSLISLYHARLVYETFCERALPGSGRQQEGAV